ncbi:hypothetical protein L1887_22983 [Cichorium endivia]|nr:hypothetical protein L1887_22983 [Cichorium endivia]
MRKVKILEADRSINLIAVYSNQTLVSFPISIRSIAGPAPQFLHQFQQFCFYILSIRYFLFNCAGLV